MHQWMFHRHYNNVVTIIIITVSIILLQLHPSAIAIIIKKNVTHVRVVYWKSAISLYS